MQTESDLYPNTAPNPDFILIVALVLLIGNVILIMIQSDLTPLEGRWIRKIERRKETFNLDFTNQLYGQYLV